MVKVHETQIPHASRLHHEAFDFADSFQVLIIDPADEVDLLTVVKTVFHATPFWVGFMMWLRNQIVALFGLKTGDSNKDLETILNEFNGQVGDSISLFKVIHRSDEELIFAEQDKHLDFQLSFLLEPQSAYQKLLTATTTVQFNNRLGRIYFRIIKPFHKIIVRSILRRTAKKLNDGTRPSKS